MTYIIWKTQESTLPVEFIDNTHTPRELIKGINTGALVLGPRRPGVKLQCATYEPSLMAVVVVERPPEVQLWPRHYDILYALIDGDNTDQIAYRLGICRRTVYLHIAEMKKRLNANSRFQMLALAMEKGLVCSRLDD